MKELSEVLEMLGKKKLTKNEMIIFNEYKNDPDFYFRKSPHGGLSATRVGYKVREVQVLKDWWCPSCQSYVSSQSVTFEETHDVCGSEVDIID